jgi:hypothetical protein
VILGYFVVTIKKIRILNRDRRRPWIMVLIEPEESSLPEFEDDIKGGDIPKMIRSVMNPTDNLFTDLANCEGKICVAYLGKIPSINGFPATLFIKGFFNIDSFGYGNV